jgi:hypothetical protein
MSQFRASWSGLIFRLLFVDLHSMGATSTEEKENSDREDEEEEEETADEPWSR